MDMSSRWEAYFSGLPGDREAATAAFKAEEDEEEYRPTLAAVARAHVLRYHRTANSMFTVQTYPIKEGERRGEVMLSYWRDAPGMLLVKQAWLEPPGTAPRNVLTTVADGMLTDPEMLRLGLRTVRVEAVLRKPLLLSLEKQSWVLEGRKYNSLTGNADKHMAPDWCCVCGGPTGEHGNNPAPVSVHCDDAQCCDTCNDKLIVPMRMRQLTE